MCSHTSPSSVSTQPPSVLPTFKFALTWLGGLDFSKDGFSESSGLLEDGNTLLLSPFLSTIILLRI
eukprot:TRINITY_DN4464_c0_g1_i1.p4 TRINITY_DN4464_c0_g1~~TRINITY_DN4464_c0_g1_i1.p4  ORF type:complete len:66 (-),score=3.64 TRINITY_DN4464_c0_g1_i1:32-229(-)